MALQHLIFCLSISILFEGVLLLDKSNVFVYSCFILSDNLIFVHTFLTHLRYHFLIFLEAII